MNRIKSIAESGPSRENHPRAIYVKSSERMTDIADESIHLTVTSPPYYAMKAPEGRRPLDRLLSGARSAALTRAACR
jgi:hypothetical protein